MVLTILMLISMKYRSSVWQCPHDVRLPYETTATKLLRQLGDTGRPEPVSGVNRDKH